MTKDSTINGFKVMTAADVNEYMLRLSSTNGAELAGIEREVEASLRRSAQQRELHLRQVEQLQGQLSRLNSGLEQLSGQMDAYGYILQKAEDERRWLKVEEEKIAIDGTEEIVEEACELDAHNIREDLKATRQVDLEKD